ncbi:hypothetical protein B0J17DRAFT_772303 [Rhizoctonia solani]|nr:hypothetical protein B0J17DRAFT_772303 [Rhizoctonia solani]
MSETLTDQLKKRQIPSPNDPTMTKKKRQSFDNGIHKLPSELLLRIFQTGAEIDRATRQKDSCHLGVQDTVTQVCSYWREIAINCPMLWTHIHITRPGPYHLASLYLTRAGASTLLGITIEMRRRWCEDFFQHIRHSYWKYYRDSAAELIVFLASQGAIASRWKSLLVCAPRIDALLTFTGLLSAEATPALRFLSRKLSHNNLFLVKRCIEDLENYNSNALQLSPFAVPRIGFDYLSWNRVFDQPSPVFSRITELKFTSRPSWCSPSQLRDLLLLNPQIEFLSFVDCPSILMTRLNTLKLSTFQYLFWILAILRMVDAPALRKLSVTSFVCTEGQEGDEGIDMGRLFYEGQGTPTLGKHHYPILEELDIHNFFYREHVIDMFNCWPSITRLYANRAQVELLKDPSMLPRLEYLRSHFKPHYKLGYILRS